MKRIYYFTAVLAYLAFCTIPAFSQDAGDISLPAPVITEGKPLMEALSSRKSSRSFASRELSPRTLSGLLWAAFGINRPESGRRTAPSASNAQEIDVYAAMSRGVFLYDAGSNKLKRILSDDIRGAAGRQPFVKNAPVLLLYVADYRRMRGQESQKDFYSAADTGFISQNVYLFCASEGLSTVVLGQFDKKLLAEKLGLAELQKIVLVQPVGYPK